MVKFIECLTFRNKDLREDLNEINSRLLLINARLISVVGNIDEDGYWNGRVYYKEV